MGFDSLYNVKVTTLKNEIRVTTYENPIKKGNKEKDKNEIKDNIVKENCDNSYDIYDLALHQFKFIMSVDMSNGTSFDCVTEEDIWYNYLDLYLDYINEHKKELIREISRIKLLKEKPLTQEQKADKSKNDSVSRAVQKVSNYGKSNTWQWFVTLTFNKKKVERENYSEVSKILSTWLNNIKKSNPDMKYLAVPEKHEKGGYHFHVLMSDIDNIKMEESGKRSYGKYIYDVDKPPKWVKDESKVRMVYNVGNYKLGWSTATKIDDNEKTVGYLTKYINKDLIDSVPKGKKKYWISKNIEKPIEEFMYIPYKKNLVEKTYNEQKKDYDIKVTKIKPFEEYITSIKKSNPKFEKQILSNSDYFQRINIIEFKKLN